MLTGCVHTGNHDTFIAVELINETDGGFENVGSANQSKYIINCNIESKKQSI